MSSEEPGFRVTIRDVYNDLQDVKRLIADRLPEGIEPRLRKVEVQVAAQWVVVALIITGLGSLIARAFTGA